MSLFRSNTPTGVRVNTRSGAKETPFTGPVWWVAGLLLAAALLVQIEFMHFIGWRGGEPSLVLILVVWYALHADWRRAAVLGIIAGACEDAFDLSGGSWTAATALTGIFANALTRWFFADSIAIACTIAFLCTLLRRMIFWIAMALTVNYPPGYARLHFHQAIWSSLMNAALMAVVMLVLRRRDELAPSR